ncbi:MAG: nucleoside-diphosphate kinase [Methanosarcinales archaeon]|nr:nucleoside-diphosphate kinase [Methanosarcinales archaeon]
MNNSNRKNERSLVLIKPDGVQRTLIGEIIKRYERSGFKLIGLKFFIPTISQIEKHYSVVDTWLRTVGEKSIKAYIEKGMKPPFDDPIKCGEKVLSNLKKYLTAGPIVAMVWQGNKAVPIIRKITGSTEPTTSDIGTIRGDFTLDSYELADIDNRAVRNLVHASGTPEEAEKEINIWFTKDEIIKYRLFSEEILYDINLDRIKE